VTDVLYITGMNRSGSTAFERFLAAHDGTVAAGEVSNLWLWGVDERLCSCGEPLDRCPFWGSVRSSAFGESGVPDEVAASAIRRYANRTRLVPLIHHPPRGMRDGLALVRSHLQRLYDAIAGAAQGRLVVDSSKYPTYAHLLSVTPGVRTAFVHLVRDSRAVAFSFGRRRARPEIHWTHMEMTTAPPAKAAAVWDVRFAASLALRRYAPTVQLRYEDFVADPSASAAHVRALLEGAGMTTLGPRREDADPRWYHSAQGNPVRFEKHFSIRADEEWRSAMSARNKLVVSALTAPFLALHRFGIGFA